MTSARRAAAALPDPVDDPQAFGQMLARIGHSAQGVDLAPDDADPHTARIRRALVLAMAGKTQEEIGETLGVAPRTVRRWLAQARAQGLVRFQGPSPEQIVARAGFMHDHLEGILLARLEQAREAGDTTALVRCVRELRGIQRDRAWLLRVTGYLAQVRFAEPPQPLDKDRLELLELKAFAYVTLRQLGLVDADGNRVRADADPRGLEQEHDPEPFPPDRFR